MITDFNARVGHRLTPGVNDSMLNVVGFRCAVCAATVDVATPLPWRCPRAIDGDRHHVLQIVRRMAPLRPTDDPNPFVSYDAELAWAAFAEAHGMTADARTALVRELDEAVGEVDGTGFRVTPFAALDALSDELGFATDGGVWVKDETGNVAGSHKARHLFTALLHLRAAELLGLAPWSAIVGPAAGWRSPRAATPRWPRRRSPAPWRGRSKCSCRTGPTRRSSPASPNWTP